MRIARGRWKSDSVAAAGAFAALALAAATQYVSGSRGVDGLVVAGYVAAGSLFAATGLRAVTTARPQGGSRLPHRRPRYAAAGCGLAAALILGVLAFMEVRESLEHGGAWKTGAVLWAASLVVMLATALLTRPLPAHSPAWQPEKWPAAPRLRRGLMVAIAGLLVVAAAARLVALDSIPLGINADEGDRASSALSLLSGEAPQNMFASGWFYISNVYFWLLAGVLKIRGAGLAEARTLGAVAGWLTLVVIVAIAYRNFGHRMALLTAVLGSALAVMLQFSRETTEATPTALCWALSIAFLLEAGRRGGTWPWLAAGVAGGLSLYFYPSGRLWVVLAGLVCLYLVARAGRGYRRVALAGGALTTLATLLTLGPFLANAAVHPDEVFRRTRQVSVFSEENAARLRYYDPDWNVVQLMWEQLKHSFAIFARDPDGAGFWPTDRPILGSALTVLVALGLGWFMLSWRHVPRFTIALWFWVGFAGMVATVETPNLQRMATAIPALPLLAAGVLDATAGRLRVWTRRTVPEWDAGGLVVGAVVLFVALGLTAQQARFYFGTYADMDRWPQPTIQGQAVAEQGRDALVATIARESHQIDSGWVRLLAYGVPRLRIPSPGSALPLATPATSDLAFILYPKQLAYVPFLREVYPGGSVREYTHQSEGLVVTAYRIPRSRAAVRQGALVTAADGSRKRVGSLGDVVPGTRTGTRLRWTAALHVPQFWNYALRVGPGPARLEIGGETVLEVPAGQGSGTVTVSLARGPQLLTLDGVAADAAGPTVEWRATGTEDEGAPAGFQAWRALATHELVPTDRSNGLAGTVSGAGIPLQRRLDGAIATCCLSAETGGTGEPFVAEWRGTLTAPKSGSYRMALDSEGDATLWIDGRTVLSARHAEDRTTAARVPLRLGKHSVRLRYRVANSAGLLEWRWTPPGQPESIVPPSALEPEPYSGAGRPIPAATLGRQPADTIVVADR